MPLYGVVCARHCALSFSDVTVLSAALAALAARQHGLGKKKRALAAVYISMRRALAVRHRRDKIKAAFDYELRLGLENGIYIYSSVNNCFGC